MKLYDYAGAPNPRRVRIFLVEKGIQLPMEQVDMAAAQHRSPEFLKKNSLGQLPVLEMDDGMYLAETVAICRYFEEVKPEPPLMGVDARDKAIVEMWQRRMEYQLWTNAGNAFRNLHDWFKGKISQVPEYGEVCRTNLAKAHAWLDSELASREFIAGPRYTIADITALVAIDFGRIMDVRIQPGQKNLTRWYEAVSARPSAKA